MRHIELIFRLEVAQLWVTRAVAHETNVNVVLFNLGKVKVAMLRQLFNFLRHVGHLPVHLHVLEALLISARLQGVQALRHVAEVPVNPCLHCLHHSDEPIR